MGVYSTFSTEGHKFLLIFTYCQGGLELFFFSFCQLEGLKNLLLQDFDTAILQFCINLTYLGSPNCFIKF